MSFPRRPHSLMDCEVFRDFFLCKWRDADSGQLTSFAMWPGQPLDRMGLLAKIASVTAVTFNGLAYDQCVLAAALAGYSCEQIKFISDRIIQTRLSAWDCKREFQLPEILGLDMIDLREVPPKQADDFYGPSLKIYGGKLHSHRIQDLPLEHTASVVPAMRPVVDNYCGNDLETTADLRSQFITQLEHREALTEKYGVDLRSKSDAQIAETVIKRQLAFKPDVPTIYPGTTFYYEPAPFLFFQTPQLKKLLHDIARVPFVVGNNGSPQLPDALKELRIPIGRNAYTVRMGGLHSTETVVAHVAGSTHKLRDLDVTSFYPMIVDILGLFPKQLGEAFLVIFRKLISDRVAAKGRGDKKLADLLKIVINGTFGKLGSPYSILYAPHLMLQVTITGQLALLMLIEAMELNQIDCVSANTDGIVLKCLNEQEARRDEVAAWWQKVTGFTLEHVDYAAIFSRDVNSYIAFKLNGEAKKKGEFADPVPVASSWPNPECQISVDALVSYLRDGTPIEQTVRACTDVRKFVVVRKVSGGGSYCGVALGRAVRWYYSKQGACILNGKGHKVANSEGCRPMMELMDTLPDDLDFDYYITRAKKMMLTVGVVFA